MRIVLTAVFAAAAAVAPAQQPSGNTAPKPNGAAAPNLPTPSAESIEVTGFRTPIAAIESPVSTRILTAKQLQQTAPVGLDGKLRTVPGFDLFRRSSSLVANPTTEGVSLRGLGSTAASRSLVLLGDVPINDPFGGWIHWLEIPALAVGRVEVVRGGVSDLYGSSAVGGVVQISPTPLADKPALVLESGFGAQGLNDNEALLSGGRGRWAGLASAGLIGTDGYTLVAPSLRGPVDVHSNVHAENALVFGERRLGPAGSGQGFFLRGNVLNEDRHNGTPLTTNATRLWRYSAGLDKAGRWGDWQGRAWGSTVAFRQNFSSVTPGRVSETLTRSASDPADELGGAIRWRHAFFPELVALAGSDVRDIRAEDTERPTARTAVPTTTTARQTDAGGYGELLWTPGPWLFSASARADRFLSRDAAQYALTTGARKTLPSIDQVVVDPRAGISRRLGKALALSASGFRAYRAPTENELYRNGQVGQQNTLANANLLSERTTGWETGIAGETPSRWGASWRGSYFWNEVNRPITALTLSTTPTATTLQRENLGQIRSRGISLDGAIHPAAWLELTGGYQFAHATVTRYNPSPALSTVAPNLVGRWIPQVPRNTGTLQVVASQPRLGLLSVQARVSGRQYDDDLNTFILHPFTRFDVYAAHNFSPRWQLFTSVENLFDRSVDVGRTPIRTLGTPQLARFGVRLTLGSGS